MQTNYQDTVAAILRHLKQQGSSLNKIHSHESCYHMLQLYLESNDIPFSIEAAVDWNENRRSSLSYDTYISYRNALFRLEHYLLKGNINTPFCRSVDCFYCKSGLSIGFINLLEEMETAPTVFLGQYAYERYAVVYREFFKHSTRTGITDPSQITVDHVLDFWQKVVSKQPSLAQRQHQISAITTLMNYLAGRGDVPRCYRMVLRNGNADTITKTMKLPYAGAVIHPSMKLEKMADRYLEALDKWQYKASSKRLYSHDLLWYFMFLEFNHVDHSHKTITAWTDCLPDDSLKDRRHRTIVMFACYLQGNMAEIRVIPHICSSDTLPEWSLSILNRFIENRRHDGMAEKTIAMCRASGYRFFNYLKTMGVQSPDAITPEIIKEFHVKDEHATPESKNAYSIKIRQLLSFMADEGLISQTLVYVVSASSAPRRSIVTVLNDEMVAGIYGFRESASSPLELRDIAIVMLGLRMGIRSSDILALQISDFNWKQKTLSFIQKKTRKAITLPVPTDVGNSVYRYIVHGRPLSGEDGNGYVFIHHLAPYVNLTSNSATRNALQRVLAACGYELPYGQGFHITRKTFATRLLTSHNSIHDIADALGHARKETSEVYLERDEGGMRLCPLPFGGVIQL